MTPIRYVSDSSIVAKTVLIEPDSPRVKTLLAGCSLPQPAHQLWVPDYYLVECTNALWYQTLRQRITASEAIQYLPRLRSLPLRIRPSIPLLPRALEIALSCAVSPYDGLFIALAEKLHCALITADTKQANAAALLGIALKPITDFPPAP